jgi:hypothetical protein
MGALQVVLGLVCVAATVVAVAMLAVTTARMVRTIRLGQPDPTRNGPFLARLRTVVKEVLGHTRMLKWTRVGIAHWLVMMGFLGLLLVVAEAYGEVFRPSFELPVLGEWSLWNLWVEILGWGTVFGILTLIVIRQRNHPRRADRQSRFAGSNMGQAYFIEGIVLVEGLGVAAIRPLKEAAGLLHTPAWSAPITHALASILPASDAAISVVAAIKILSGMAFIIAISLSTTMGVAWHRFTAFVNIYFKREADGAVALGALRPMMSAGEPLNFEEADPDKDVFGAGKVEDFGWKGWLDFSTCTECGRCQSQCPAWNTGKPLSPKLLITSLRDHAHAKAPYLLAGGKKDMAGDEVGITGDDAEARLAKIDVLALAEAGRPLVGGAEELGVSTTSSTCAATRCSSSRTSRPSWAGCSRTWRTRATPGARTTRTGWLGPRAWTSSTPPA